MTHEDFVEEFAEINAGDNFIIKGDGYRVRLVGYNQDNRLLIVSGHPDGWEAFKRHDGDVFVAWVSLLFSKLYYVEPYDLIICHDGE